MEDKTRFITPFLMLLGGAIAAIIMCVRGYELTRMLWILLIVLVIFYFLGDTARYIYSRIKPRIIPDVDYDEMERKIRESLGLSGNVVEYTNEEGTQDEENTADGEAQSDINSEVESFDRGE